MAGSRTLRSTSDPLRQVSAPIVRWTAGRASDDRDELAAEEPLEIRALGHAMDHTESHDSDGHDSDGLDSDGLDSDGHDSDGDAGEETIAVIMRTPGHDDELAAGFLYSEGLLQSHAELQKIIPGLDSDGLPSPNILAIETAGSADLLSRMRDAGYTRRFAVNASCGVCGKNTVAAACEAFPRLPLDDFAVDPDLLYALPACLQAEQRVFHSTGGLHAAGLFDARGALLAMREDVGRHNAVDKLIGRALLDDALPLRARILLVSGRLSFEIVQKALAAGISLIAAVSAPSSLAVDLAEAGGVTLAAFLRGERVNVYTHPQRVRSQQYT